jgi:hypothetical protein
VRRDAFFCGALVERFLEVPDAVGDAGFERLHASGSPCTWDGHSAPVPPDVGSHDGSG